MYVIKKQITLNSYEKKATSVMSNEDSRFELNQFKSKDDFGDKYQF